MPQSVPGRLLRPCIGAANSHAELEMRMDGERYSGKLVFCSGTIRRSRLYIRQPPTTLEKAYCGGLGCDWPSALLHQNYYFHLILKNPVILILTVDPVSKIFKNFLTPPQCVLYRRCLYYSCRSLFAAQETPATPMPCLPKWTKKMTAVEYAIRAHSTTQKMRRTWWHARTAIGTRFIRVA